MSRARDIRLKKLSMILALLAFLVFLPSLTALIWTGLGGKADSASGLLVSWLPLAAAFLWLTNFLMVFTCLLLEPKTRLTLTAAQFLVLSVAGSFLSIPFLALFEGLGFPLIDFHLGIALLILGVVAPLSAIGGATYWALKEWTLKEGEAKNSLVIILDADRS